PAVEDYMNKVQMGLIKSPETMKKEEEKKRQEARFGVKKMICPTCRRPSLKMTPHRIYACGHCGLETNSPSYVYETKK
ncbi:unnamed protein product, partial [marine sediment metagenome]